jgi:uncharacterized HAD superfamily protein
MTVAFDIDDVLAEFQFGWVEFNNTKYGMNMKFSDINDFSYAKVMNISEEEVFKRIFEFYETEIITRLVPVEGAVETVDALSKGNTLYVITSRPQEIAAMTRNWLNRYYSDKFREILFTGQISRDGFDHKITKADICKRHKIDWLVEDAPIHAVHVAEAGINVALLEKPWNKDVTINSNKIHRIKSMRELRSLENLAARLPI